MSIEIETVRMFSLSMKSFHFPVNKIEFEFQSMGCLGCHFFAAFVQKRFKRAFRCFLPENHCYQLLFGEGSLSSFFYCRPSGVVVRGVGCCTKGPGLGSRVMHRCQTVRPRPHQWLSGSAPKIGRRGVPGSILGRASLPTRSEFSVVFSETRLNTG